MNEVNAREKQAELLQWLGDHNQRAILEYLKDWHPADIADLFYQLQIEDRQYILSILGNEQSANVLLELEEEDRAELLDNLTATQIAQDVIIEMDTDDAADVISELSDDKKKEVISQIEDSEHAKDIVDLLRYDEDTAGGLMGKELVMVYNSWNVIRAVREMRRQAEYMEEVYSVYVVDDDQKLLGILSLKKLLTTSSNTIVNDVYNPKFRAVAVTDSAESVALDIQKYDLYEVPVIDELGKLVGRITVDDVIDVIREEAEKDYQLASGISQDVGIEDSIWSLTRARLPWLLIGVAGSLVSSRILDGNLDAMEAVPMLILFIPLIAATAGNMGVQSSAIVVQALASGSMKRTLGQNLSKEVLIGILNGIALALVLFAFSAIFYDNYLAAATISVSLFAVIVVAAIVGTTIPLFLEKKGIDPAIATGPFITTSNDVIGISIYFLVAKLMLGI
ncbi:MAG: magnesium transporter [Weeksellaceae bacterium]|nr:magnesium transporter [Weeksellaceae bacterium]